MEKIFDDMHNQVISFLNISPNTNLDDIIPAKDRLPKDFPDEIKIIFMVFYIAIIVLALVGNVVVIVIIVTNKQMRCVTNIFIVSLAVSCLLIATLNMPFQLKFYVTNEWTLGEHLCKFSNYIQGVTIASTVINLAGIAVDRYQAICNPLKARHIHTVSRACVLVSLFWLLSLLVVTPQLFIQRIEPLLKIQLDKTPPLVQVWVCAEYFQGQFHYEALYTCYIYFVLYLIPLVIIAVTYTRIAHYLWIRKPIGDALENPRNHGRHLQEKKRIIRMLIVLIVVFGVCWFPFFTCQFYILVSPGPIPYDLRVAMACFHMVGYMNACINPIVYCFMSREFHKCFRRTLVYCLSGCKRRGPAEFSIRTLTSTAGGGINRGST